MADLYAQISHQCNFNCFLDFRITPQTGFLVSYKHNADSIDYCENYQILYDFHINIAVMFCSNYLIARQICTPYN